MSEEYFYCWNCQTRLASSDFERGRAFQIHDKITCTDCVQQLLAPLPVREQEAVLLMVKEAQEKAKRPPSRSAIPVPPGGIPAHAKIHAHLPSKRSNPVVVAFLVIALVAVAIVIAYQIHTGATYLPPRPAARPETPRPRPAPPPPPSSPREAEAREALRKADEFARANPDDAKGQETNYQEALKAAEGTSLHAEAKGKLEEIRKRLAASFSTDLAALDEQSRAACGREEYKAAIDLLDQARKRRPDTSWSNAIDQRTLAVNQEAWKAYIPLREKALDANRRGAKDETQAVADRVKRWGLEALITDLEKGLAAPPPKPPTTVEAPPPIPPETRPAAAAPAYLKAWEKAASIAASHDFARAARELEEAAKSAEDASVRAQAAADQENFRLAADFQREALLLLSKWPKGQKLRLAWIDENGQKAEIEGPVHRADAFTVDFARNREVVGVPAAEALPSSLAEILPGNARGAAVLCLLSGDPEGARKAEGDPAFKAPEHYWAFARRSAEETAKGAGRDPARKLFWAAEREFRSAGTRGRAIEKIATLLSEHAASPLVRRNRGLLTQRIEAGRDYYFLADGMTASGVFTPAQYPKVESCWTSETDVPAAKAKGNYVEFEFYALPDAPYRCWVHVGACCGETFAFHYQATDSGEAEPGGPNGLPAKHQILFLKKYHVQHGGAKEPSRWEWAWLPLPKYSVAGIKKVRVISDQQGFSVARAVVSSTRQTFPREQEMKEIEKALAAERPGAAKEPGPEAPAAGPAAPDARPWRPVFDGRTTDCLTRESAAAWRVEDGALVPAPGANAPAETKELFAEGEIRVRFESRDLESLFFKALQSQEGSYRISWDEAQLRALQGKTHELVFTCRKDSVTAEINGKAVALARTGQHGKGSLQFGAVGKSFRVLSIEQR